MIHSTNSQTGCLRTKWFQRLQLFSSGGFRMGGGGGGGMWQRKVRNSPTIWQLQCLLLHFKYTDMREPHLQTTLAAKVSVLRAADMASNPTFLTGLFPGQAIPMIEKLVLKSLPCQVPGLIGSSHALAVPASVKKQVWSASSISVWQHIQSRSVPETQWYVAGIMHNQTTTSSPAEYCPTPTAECWLNTIEAWQTERWVSYGGGQSAAGVEILRSPGSLHWTESTHQHFWKFSRTTIRRNICWRWNVTVRIQQNNYKGK